MPRLNVFDANPTLAAVYTIGGVTITVKDDEGQAIAEPMAVLQVQYGFSTQVSPIFDLVSKDMILIRGIPMGEINLSGMVGGTNDIISFIQAFSTACSAGGSIEIRSQTACPNDPSYIKIKFSTAIMKSIGGAISVNTPAPMTSIAISCYNMEIEVVESSSSSGS